MAWKPVRPRALTVSADPFARSTPYRVEGAAQRQPASPYDRSLNKSAANWIQELPPAVRPRESVIRFPRILNRLARYWDSPAMLEQTFNDLLVDKRIGRKGFPPEILSEIRALYAHYRYLHPERDDAADLWSSVPARARPAPRWRG
jgi:hypothetical protein